MYGWITQSYPVASFLLCTEKDGWVSRSVLELFKPADGYQEAINSLHKTDALSECEMVTDVANLTNARANGTCNVDAQSNGTASRNANEDDDLQMEIKEGAVSKTRECSSVQAPERDPQAQSNRLREQQHEATEVHDEEADFVKQQRFASSDSNDAMTRNEEGTPAALHAETSQGDEKEDGEDAGNSMHEQQHDKHVEGATESTEPNQVLRSSRRNGILKPSGKHDETYEYEASDKHVEPHQKYHISHPQRMHVEEEASCGATTERMQLDVDSHDEPDESTRNVYTNERENHEGQELEAKDARHMVRQEFERDQSVETLVPKVVDAVHKREEESMRDVHEQIVRHLRDSEPDGRKCNLDVPSPRWYEESAEMLQKRHSAEDRLTNEAYNVREARSSIQSRAHAAKTELEHCKNHWDYVLVEVRWFANDVAGERAWKRNAAQTLANACARLNGKPQDPVQELERQRRSVASTLSAEICMFWRKMWAVAMSRPSRDRMREKRVIEQWAVRTMQNEADGNSAGAGKTNASGAGWAWQVSVAGAMKQPSDDVDNASIPLQHNYTAAPLTFPIKGNEMERVREQLVQEEKERFENYQKRKSEWDEQERVRVSAEQEARRVEAKRKEEERLRLLEHFYTSAEIDRRRKAAQQQRLLHGADARAQGSKRAARPGQQILGDAEDDEEGAVYEHDRTRKNVKRGRRVRNGDMEWTQHDDGISASEDENQNLQPQHKRSRKGNRAVEQTASAAAYASVPTQDQRRQGLRLQQAHQGIPGQYSVSYTGEQDWRFTLREDLILLAVIKDYGENFSFAAEIIKQATSLYGVHRSSLQCKRRYKELERDYRADQLDSRRKEIMQTLSGDASQKTKMTTKVLFENLPLDPRTVSALGDALLEAFKKAGIGSMRNRTRREASTLKGASNAPSADRVHQRPQPHASWYQVRSCHPLASPYTLLGPDSSQVEQGKKQQYQQDVRQAQNMNHKQHQHVSLLHAGVHGMQQQQPQPLMQVPNLQQPQQAWSGGAQRSQQANYMNNNMQPSGMQASAAIPHTHAVPAQASQFAAAVPVAAGQPLHQHAAREATAAQAAPGRGSGGAGAALQYMQQPGLQAEQMSKYNPAMQAGMTNATTSAVGVPGERDAWRSQVQQQPQLQHQQQQPHQANVMAHARPQRSRRNR